MMFASSIPNENFWIPLVAGGVGALVVALIQIIFALINSVKSPNHQKKGSSLNKKTMHDSWLTQPIYTSTTWSFKDSWATNLTTVGAVLGTVTASTSTFQSITGSTSSDSYFVILAIFFGGASGLSPLIYASLAKKPHPDYSKYVVGSVGGLLIGNTVTLFATLGELAAVGMIVSSSNVTVGERIFFIGALSLAAFFVILYTLRSFSALVLAEPPDKSDPKLSVYSGTASFMNSSGNSATL